MPFARYVLENAGKLAFPFRRYQIQKVWRGERPQEGRFREFTQADIDIVDAGTLPFHYEVELPLVIADAFSRLPIPPFRIQVNNRQIPEGFYRGLGIEDVTAVLRIVDKLDKIGPDKVARAAHRGRRSGAVAETGEAGAAAGRDLADRRLVRRPGAGARRTARDPRRGARAARRDHDRGQRARPRSAAWPTCKVARGLDYYTGTVYETQLVGHESYGSICSGGRYDALASDGKTTYPGRRDLDRRLPAARPAVQPGPGEQLAQYADRRTGRAQRRGRAGPTRCVPRPRCAARGIPVEVAPAAAKFGKQIKFADRRGIPFVWFGTENGSEVKDIRSGEQVAGRPGHLGAATRRRPYDPQLEAELEPSGELVIRTHSAGSLRAEHTGQTVTLAGWVARRRDHGGVAFIDLRDSSGTVQVVIRDEEAAHALRAEYCLKIVGAVSPRPEGNANPNLPTGEVEVIAAEVEVLQRGRAAAVPGRGAPRDAGERGGPAQAPVPGPAPPGPGAAIRLRSKVNRAARDVLDEHDFVEIETPTLTRSTPEGARDFLVPARLQPGSWYALPQSPQLFKQLLMVAGMERYYQIARCYRDEDFRADRQPEFTQLDIEMSFVDQDDIIALSEEILTELWKLAGHEIQTPIQRMTYAEAMARFGSDKPDLRMGLELVECTEYFADTPFRVFQAQYVGAVVMPGGADQPRKQLDAWQDWAKQRGARGLAYVLVGQDGELGGPVAKNLSEQERAGLAEHVGAKPGDCIFFAAGPAKSSRALLGAARLEIGRRGGLIDESAWSFVWVVDAPLFEPADEATAAGDVAVGSGAWTAVHHAFTSPKPDSMETFDTDPGSALAYAYDIVCNGNEIGGGSIRIHREDVQKRVFAVMGLTEEEATEKFGFLLDAF